MLRAVLLALLLAAPTIAAQVRHEDPSRAQDDYSVLRKLAQTVLSGSVATLNLSLEDDHAAAGNASAAANDIVEGMRDVVRSNASEATSARRLAPMASAASGLGTHTSELVAEWEELRLLLPVMDTREEALRGRFLLALLEEDIAGGYLDAVAFEALGFDATYLRAALARFDLAAIEELIDDVEETLPPGSDDAILLLQVTPDPATLLRPVTVRGALVGAPNVSGWTVVLRVDGAAWGNATTRASGLFDLTRDVPVELGRGNHSAQAQTRLGATDVASELVNFTVQRIPTRLSLAAPNGPRAVLNATIALRVALTDDRREAVAGNVTLTAAGVALPPLRVVGAATTSWLAAPVGRREIVAEFAGDELHEPSDARLVLVVVAPRAVPPPTPFDLWIVVLMIAAAGAQAALLARARRASPGRWRVALAASPALPIAVGAWRAGLPGAAIGAFVGLAVTGAFAVWSRGADEGAPPEREVGPTVPPEVRAAIEEKLAPLAAAPAGRRGDLVRLYRALLLRLVAEGVDVRPMTHREIAWAMTDRGFAPGPVREIAAAIETALYAGVEPDEAMLSRVREAAAALGVPA